MRSLEDHTSATAAASALMKHALLSFVSQGPVTHLVRHLQHLVRQRGRHQDHL